MMYSVAVYSAKISSDDDFKVQKDTTKNKDYSLALANRSACLQRTKQYKLALEDIALALGKLKVKLMNFLFRIYIL